jgi:hypothetical protein
LVEQLAGLVRVVPGFEVGRIPWISFPCDSCKWPIRYAIKIEPRWDSCDGLAGTFGWDPAIVQMGFRWDKTAQELLAALNARLRAKGWEMGEPPTWGSAGDADTWDYPPSPAPQEALAIESPVEDNRWMVILEAKAEGPQVKGC